MTNPETFEQNNYLVVRNVLDPYLVKFLASYYQSVRNNEAGNFETDRTSLNCNGDACGDTVMYSLRTKIEELVGLELLPTYSFVRIYKNGESVGRHRDGPANQVSCTMCVSRDDVDWPLKFSDGTTEDQVVLEPGDGVVYRGYMMDHWRDKFTGNNQVQVIVGFVVKDGGFDEHRFYGRGEPTYAPQGATRAGTVRVAKGIIYRTLDACRKKLGLGKKFGDEAELEDR
jgi:hypothetical protein